MKYTEKHESIKHGILTKNLVGFYIEKIVPSWMALKDPVRKR